MSSTDRIAIRHLLSGLDPWGLVVEPEGDGFVIRWMSGPDRGEVLGKFPQYLVPTLRRYAPPARGRNPGIHETKRDLEVATSTVFAKFPETVVRGVGFKFPTREMAVEALEVANVALTQDKERRDKFSP